MASEGCAGSLLGKVSLIMHKMLVCCAVSQSERQSRRNSLSRWLLLCTAVRVAPEELTPEGFQLVSGQQQHSQPVKSCPPPPPHTNPNTKTRAVRVAALAARRVGGAVRGGRGVEEHRRRSRVGWRDRAAFSSLSWSERSRQLGLCSLSLSLIIMSLKTAERKSILM